MNNTHTSSRRVNSIYENIIIEDFKVDLNIEKSNVNNTKKNINTQHQLLNTLKTENV